MTYLPMFTQIFHLLISFSNGTFHTTVECLGANDETKTCTAYVGKRYKDGRWLDEMNARRLNVPYECGPAKLIDVRTESERFNLPYLYCMEKMNGGVIIAAVNKKQSKLGEEYMKEIKYGLIQPSSYECKLCGAELKPTWNEK